MKDPEPTHDGAWSELSENSDILDETVMQGDERSAPEPKVRYPPGTAVSRYVILYEVGAGGMGVVYAAFDPQLNRKIALKILTPKASQRSRGTDQAAVRLMREAQAIARLSHPNVVNVYDVGRHRDAVFVAMEFIEGETLTRWLEQRSPSLEEIRDVFARAGKGLAAAHDAGLVHRDFKPDNVLVSPDGRVRVLDFGLARADPSLASNLSQVSHVSHLSMDDDEDEEPPSPDGVPQARDFGDSDVLSSPLTLDDAVVGTPRYMAPEQHAGVGVDPRSDQFSFCVALYQALYHQDPFPADRLHELVLLKQEGRVAALPPDAGVPTWLEDLVMRGLAPRPVDRWPSMHEVVDVLEHNPEAGRRRKLAWGGGVVLLAVVMGVASNRLGTSEAQPCQDGSTHVEALWGDGQRAAVREALLGTQLPYADHTWQEVERRIDADLVAWQDAYRDACEATRLRGEQSDELLDLRMACLQDHLSEVRAVLDVFDQPDPAVVQRAVSIVSGLPGLEPCADTERLRAALPPPEDEQTADEVERQRQKLREVGALRSVTRVAEARTLAEEVLARAEDLDYEPLRVEALLGVGVVLEQAGDYDESEEHLRRALWGALRIRHDVMAARAAIQLVSVVGDRLARYDEGLTWFEQASALLDRIDEQGGTRASLLNNVGNVWHRKGDNDKALDYYQQALALREALVGRESPVVAIERINLGNAQLALGRYEEALVSYEDAKGVLERTLGKEHPQIAMAVASIGIVYNQTGRYEEALVQHREALRTFESWLGPDHLWVATTISNAGVALRGLRRYDEAEANFRRAQGIFEESLGPDHPEVARCLGNLGEVRADQGFVDEAMQLHQRALELRRQRFDEDSDLVVASRLAIADLRRRQGDAAGALVALEDLAKTAADAELDAGLRGDLHFMLAKARWDAGQLRTRVDADLERARGFLVEVGERGTSTREELDQWAKEHERDDRPRAEDGTILPVRPPVPEGTEPYEPEGGPGLMPPPAPRD
ncbi:MAG: tetratricopeptide repeat protein [Myxococcales bacterium]|nr:tetratricopeptide repeat protein [Myxococcales bacterium]